MEYNGVIDTYRLADDFLPEAQLLDVVQYGRERGGGEGKGGGSEGGGEKDHSKIGAWSPQVGIHRCTWNNAGGLGQAGWMASGGASGLGRVEWVQGVWRGAAAPGK